MSKTYTTTEVQIMFIKGELDHSSRFVKVGNQSVYLRTDVNDKGHFVLVRGYVKFMGPNDEKSLKLRDYSDDQEKWFREDY